MNIYTINTWIDADFTNFRFGDWIIDYEVSYLTLPPSESPKSNKVSTTVGNWTGPVAKEANIYTQKTEVVRLSDYAVFPNPFNPTVTLTFNLSKETDIKIVIFNLRGNKVKTLSNSTLPASDYSLVWDGKNDSGELLPSGIYLIQLTSINNSRANKVVLLR